MPEKDKDDNGYPRQLDREGCIYGRRVMEKAEEALEATEKAKGEALGAVGTLAQELAAVKALMNKASITFAVSTLLLVVDILVRLIK